jgi:glyoxylase-like metal-dependent hydrolase (beta-lactamase superfamily II)
MSWVDLDFLGRPHAIATGVIQSTGSLALVDPGPSTCLDALEAGLQRRGTRLADVTHLLLTHIHLDHAGATGTLVRQYPHLKVLVHERGAPHIVDPGKLIASASRLYGSEMERLWGEIAPVREANLVIVGEGDRVEAGGRTFEIAYTPGHASHHVSYFDPASGVAFVGDTAGVCVDGGYVLPPTPPPDIDIEAWEKSLSRIESWGPRTLFMTHFGPVHSPVPHMQMLLENLRTMAGIVRGRLQEPGSDEDKARQFAEDVTRELRRQMTEPQVASYLAAAPPDLLWLGLARYWKKKLT